MKATQPNLSLCEHLLRAGKSILDLQLGIVSYVYNDDYKLIAINDISSEYKAGDIVALDKTYCREVVESGNSIALTEINGIIRFARTPALCGKYCGSVYWLAYLFKFRNLGNR